MINLKSVSKRYGRTTAVRNVSLAVPSGDKVAVAGPNGSGKSTLLRLIAGLTSPNSGTVTVGDSPPRTSRARIGFLGHRLYLYPHLSAEENLRLYAGLYGVAPGRVGEVLRFMQLDGKRSSPMRTFSKGESQRLGIARAVLHAPDYLILDEPFSGLDKAGTEQLVDYLSNSPQTIVMTTHDPEQAGRVVDRIVQIREGSIL